MWSDWRPDMVRQDFKRLAEHGVGLLRVFPLWPDFQPITMLYGSGGAAVEIRQGELPLEEAGAIGTGVSPVMLDRLSQLCAIAAEHRLELILGLVTGWMSGRLFVPPALAGRKQAGVEMDFRQIDQPVPDAGLYLLPSLKGGAALPRRKWAELLARVRRGATLYLSLDDGIIPHFNEIAGVDVVGRSQAVGVTHLRLNDGTVLPVQSAERLLVRNRTAEVLGVRQEDGSPLFWKHRVGEGTIVVLAVPIEVALTQTLGAFGDESPAYLSVYSQLVSGRAGTVLRPKQHAGVAITEHALSPTQTLVMRSITRRRRGRSTSSA